MNYSMNKAYTINFLDNLKIKYQSDTLGIYFLFNKCEYKIIIYPDGLTRIMKTISRVDYKYLDTTIQSKEQLIYYLNTEFKELLRKNKLKYILNG